MEFHASSKAEQTPRPCGCCRQQGPQKPHGYVSCGAFVLGGHPYQDLWRGQLWMRRLGSRQSSWGKDRGGK